MVEVTEYSLVVLVSTLFVAGSVATYTNYSSYEAGLGARAAFATVSSLASQALENGSSSGTVTSGQSTLECTDGLLLYKSGSLNLSTKLPIACNFQANLTGVHVLRFAVRSSELFLGVD